MELPYDSAIPLLGIYQEEKKKILIGKHICVHTKSLQLCLTLCDSMDYSPPGFSVPGILQTRLLEVSVAMPSSRGSSQPSD